LAGVPVLSVAQTNVVNGQGIMTSPGGTEFLIYTPPGYVEGTPSPLLVNLHGQGQINPNPNTGCLSINCLRNQPSDATPAYLIHQGQWPTTRPFIVVSPQLKRDYSVPNIADQDWSAPYIDEVIEYVKTIRTINPDKIYIMGLSLGGQGCMIYAAAYPEKVAGMVPMCGRSYDDNEDTDDIIDQACSLVNIPIWFFHGTEDILLTYDNATKMAAAINACSNPGSIRPHVTLLDAMEHNGVWNPIYNLKAGYPVYDWLLQFTKNSTVNVPPHVNVGLDKKFMVSDGTIYLFADYFDADGSITSVSWSQTPGPISLTLEQTNTPILKVSNLQAGTFQFQLTVTDNLGAVSSDDVTVELLDTQGTNNATTDFRLINSLANNADIGPLINEQVINKNILGFNDFNVRAVVSNPGGSVVIRVNSNQLTRLLDGWGSFNSFYAYDHTYIEYDDPRGWQILPGDYVVCATPFTGSFGNETEGISKCVKFSVVTQTPQDYYPKPGEDLSLLASWGTETNGSGNPPSSFSANFQVFNVNKAAPQTGELAISGNESAFWVRSGGEMTVNNAFTGMINVEGNGIVNINTNQPVSFGTVSPTSTIRFGANATTIPARAYGHVEILGSGTTKTLGSGATIVAGNLVIGNGVTLNGAVDNTSTIQLTGDLTLQEEGEFNPVAKFGVTLSSGRPHALTFFGSKAAFSQLNILEASVVSVTEGTLPRTLELGSVNSGGVIIQNGSELNLGKNHLTIIGNGTLNSENQTGRIAFDRSKLSITSQSTAHSNLYTKNLSDTVSVVATNLNGSGTLFLRDSLFVLDSVKNYNGTLHANGLLTLVSSANKTANIGRVEGTGNITGDIRFQRFIRPGRMYRYLSFPVKNVSVSDLQRYIPVTGTFEGNSPGTTNPSLFHYQEPSGWLSYPTTSNTEIFALGKGYAVYMRKNTNPTLAKLAGEIHIGNFSFELNPGAVDDQSGWSLLGNPYAAPIQWGNGGWISSGINATAYIRDNEYENGRFLVWDGEEGDEEFAGLIAQGQSFWVKAFDPNINPSLTVQETAKANAQATLYRTKEESGSNLIISLNHNGLTDRTFLKFNNRSGLKFDPRFDGVKQRNSYYNLAVITTDSVLTSIKNMPDTCSATLALSIENVKAGTYALNFSGSALDHDREFILRDLYLDSLLQVKADDTYVFQVTEHPDTYGNQRFELIATVDIPQPEISVKNGDLISSIGSDIQWLLDGEEIPGATQSVYTPLVSGQYQVRIWRSSCTNTSLPFTYIITGVESKNNAYQLYPNPAQHLVTVKGISKPTPYALLNIWGQVIQNGLLSSEHMEIDLNVPAGLYVISLEDESGLYRYKLLIK
jgi:predicted esterase